MSDEQKATNTNTQKVFDNLTTTESPCHRTIHANIDIDKVNYDAYPEHLREKIRRMFRTESEIIFFN